MTGPEVYALRQRFKLSALEFGRLIGLQGRRDNIKRTVRRLENGRGLLSAPQKQVLEELAKNAGWVHR